MSAREFTERANTLCTRAQKRFRRQFEALFADLNQRKPLPSQPEQLKELVETAFAPTYEDLVDKVEALGAPSSRDEDIAAFLNVAKQDIEFARQRPSKVFKGFTPLTRSVRAARAAGLGACVKAFGG